MSKRRNSGQKANVWCIRIIRSGLKADVLFPAKKYKVKDANRQTGSEVAERDKEKGETEVLLPPCLTLKKYTFVSEEEKTVKSKEENNKKNQNQSSTFLDPIS